MVTSVILRKKKWYLVFCLNVTKTKYIVCKFSSLVKVETKGSGHKT